jgi:hypothetical protein
LFKTLSKWWDKLLHRVHFVFADPDVVEQERIEGRD